MEELMGELNGMLNEAPLWQWPGFTPPPFKSAGGEAGPGAGAGADLALGVAAGVADGRPAFYDEFEDLEGVG